MKATCMMLFTTFILFFTNLACAALFESNCPHQHCKRVVACSSNSCAERQPTIGCNCSDLGMNYNDCMDRKVYCQVYGDIGKLED